MKFAITASLFLCFSSAIAADRFTYKGVGVGDEETTISEKLPYYKKSKYSQHFYRHSSEECSGIRRSSDEEAKKCFDANSFGGAVVSSGELYVKDGRISKITLNFDPSWNNGLVEAISGKYGKEKTRDVSELQNGYGAKFPAVLTEWESNGSILSMSSIGGKETSIQITSAADRQKSLERAKADKEKSAKDF
ncbi:hypothetical protein N5C96_23250 [Delftia tsuruhatensis]|uniref:hypothetical protein n=1 Tax=Delftia tsuruhatensis TaxID=180282 RepID=UPI002444E94C|nr:hypothetical protein [Delftia tsuruhatensis]MDH0776330.1 hypothetical protein [Delftia tsuruhatensis]MDH1460115.1 hypothetical protein [Delftia tsuruhatensis]MDH1823078.1 hypothetical protein [Delftia tsuruhatensis]WGG12283.1 hypothetical protein N5O86_06470 [Delftia tsuruhatensis]